MKHVLFVFILSLFLSCQALAISERETDLNLASYNIRIFSAKSRDGSERWQIYEILDKYDFVAIQEARDPIILDRALSFLKDEFGLDYAYLASPREGRGVKEIDAILQLMFTKIIV